MSDMDIDTEPETVDTGSEDDGHTAHPHTPATHPRTSRLHYNPIEVPVSDDDDDGELAVPVPAPADSVASPAVSEPAAGAELSSWLGNLGLEM
jgi:hypothetical protein